MRRPNRFACVLVVTVIAGIAPSRVDAAAIAGCTSSRYDDYLSPSATLDGCGTATASPPGECDGADRSRRRASGERYADYLTLGPTSVRRRPRAVLGTSGSEECSEPTAKRRGAWVCINRSPAIAREGVREAPTRTGTWCTTDGCYTMIDNWHAMARMSGTYGWGGHTIGSIKWQSKFSASGAQMRSYAIDFTPDNAVQDVHMSGMLLHGSHSDYGLEVSGTYEEISKGNVAANVTASWGGNGYFSYSKSYLNHANVMEVAWEEASVPDGYWYAYVKSLVAEDPDDDNNYRFRNETYMFRDSAEGGWHGYP